MTAPSILALITATLALGAAGVAHPFVTLQRWKKHRMLVPIALTAASYSLADMCVTMASVPDRTLVWLDRAQLSAAALFSAAWVQYAEDDLGPIPRKVGPIARGVLLAFAVLSFVPGVTTAGRVATHRVPELGLVYRDVVPSTLGTLAMAAMLAGLLLAAIAYGEAAIRGVPHAFGHFVALLAMLVAGANDAIVSFGAAAMPYLLDVGNLVQVCVLMFTMTRRWAQDIHALAGLPQRPRGLTEVSSPGRAAPRPRQ